MNITESIKKLNELDLAELDFENMGGWPIQVRVIACVLIFLLSLLIGYQFYLNPMQIRLSQVQEYDKELREQFRIKAFKAANLDAYRQQMKEIESSFGALVRQLPGDTEVPGLLEDITSIGRTAGLQFEAIKLQPEKATEFYIELPISISVTGTYHEMGNFVSGVASLSRIVTLHDFTIQPSKEGQLLRMEILAKTYRYNYKDPL